MVLFNLKEKLILLKKYICHWRNIYKETYTDIKRTKIFNDNAFDDFILMQINKHPILVHREYYYHLWCILKNYEKYMKLKTEV